MKNPENHAEYTISMLLPRSDNKFHGSIVTPFDYTNSIISGILQDICHNFDHLKHFFLFQSLPDQLQ